jgi:hypothetical protein
VATSIATPTAGAAGEPGSQGIDTSLPLTDSAVTVNGRGPFAELRVTVNQTRNLTNQAVSITWEGGTPTTSGPGRFAANYLQIFQCWGDDDGTVAGNPGPPPEQCVQGGILSTFPPASVFPNGLATSREVARSDWPNFDEIVADGGVYDQRSSSVWLPFRAVDGTVVDIPVDPTFIPGDGGGNYWLNPYFNGVTSNEIPGAITGRDGRGAELFRVDTGIESSGLGCGQRVQPLPDGGRKVPDCWIVVVPRGEPAAENSGSPFATNADQFGVYTSPLYPAAWQNRIAIPVEFNPVDSPCSLADDERRLAGNELIVPALSSWQPAICSIPGLPPYSFATVGDALARRQVQSPTAGSPGMVVVQRPIDAASRDPANPIVYAPLSASGIVIGFNIERVPRLEAPDAAQQLSGVRVAELNLTPRLVAKLLTQSYASQVDIFVTPPYPWLTGAPSFLAEDPDFLRFNPEFALLSAVNRRTFGGLQLPAGNSDAARQVWEWIFADAEARAWMAGEPDEWGMRVNPVYSTNPATNPSGIAFGAPLPESFPKADPYCYVAPPRGPGGAPGDSVVPAAICGTDWMPYTRGLRDGARITRDASDGARIAINDTAQTSNDVWKAVPPQYSSYRSILSVTDSASAAQFGLQVARLSRAGDDGPERTFVAPSAASLGAGVAVMRAGSEPSVLEPAPSIPVAEQAAGGTAAYPLTAITYAAIAPLAIDTTARTEYAALLDYAAGAGQTPGLAYGQLPPGYVPLPERLRDQTSAAADTVRTLTAAPPPATSTTSTTTTTTVPAPASPATFPPAAGGPFPSFQAPGGTGGFGPSTPSPPVVDTATPVAAPAPVAPVAGGDLVATPGDEVVDDPGPTLLTPVLAIGRSRLAVPSLGAVALVSALGALEITKRPRRRLSAPDELDPGPVGGV